MIGSIIARNKTKSAFKSLNERDIQSFISAWTEDASFVYPGKLTVSREVKGKKDITKWFENFLENFTQFKFSLKNVCVEKIFDFTGSNVVSVEWNIEGKNKSGNSFRNSGVTIIEIKKTKAVRVQDYIFDHEEQKRAWGE
jgi:ketosteroid isomerase-like protein